MSRLALVAALAVTLLTTGAALAGPERAPGVGPLTGNVLLLPVRVEVYEAAPAGVALLKADWTQSSRGYVETALEGLLGASRATIVRYAAPLDPDREDRHRQVLTVQGLVRAAIITHRYGDHFALPSKRRFEWSLGPAASVLGNDTPATHALFVDLSERRLSRHFVRIGSLGDEFAASASVVDLGTGDVVWFNYERSGSVGTALDALTSVKRLLRDFPF